MRVCGDLTLSRPAARDWVCLVAVQILLGGRETWVVTTVNPAILESLPGQPIVSFCNPKDVLRRLDCPPPDTCDRFR